MFRWVERGIPLPLGAVNNRRSMVYVRNLTSLLMTCIDHPAASGQVFLAADGEDVSTTTLLVKMATALGKPSRLIPIPTAMLQSGASLLGKSAIAQRLLGSLQVSTAKANTVLGWRAPYSMDQGLRNMVRQRQKQ
jgi:nucleoside-diphosphate-sugar epimerase